jgi:glycosyltransferase involved in cell wall biosynthesis
MLLWKLHTLDYRIASVRYRALIPVQALSRRGHRSLICKSFGVDQLCDVEAVIFVKSLALKDLLFAQRASEAGIPVVLDLCDNIFVPHYGVKCSIAASEVIQLMARYATVITTTGQALADVLRRNLEVSVPVMTVVDGIDDEALSRVGRRMLRQAHWTALWRMLTSVSFWIRVTPKLRSKVAARASRWWSEHVGLSFRMSRRSEASIEHTIARTSDGALDSAEYPTRKTLIWFGHAGGDYGRFGLSDLVDIAPSLHLLARRIRFTLLVVSNDREAYQRLVEPLALDTRYVEWNSESIRSLIRKSDLTIVPNSRDPFAICKSANRAVLSLSLGVPVVASPTPAMEVLEGCVMFDDWVEGSYRYLTEPMLVREHLGKARPVLEKEFGLDRIAGQWEDVLDRARRSKVRSSARGLEQPHPKVAVVIHLMQDLDLALPVLREIKGSQNLGVQAWVSLSVFEASPRVWKGLRQHDVDVRVLDDQTDVDLEPIRSGEIGAVLTITETNQSPHRFPHRIATLANEMGIATFTMQHGYENIGLTYTDERYPIERIAFASKTIFTWGHPTLLHPNVPASTRAKCIPVGCCKVVPSDVVALPLPVNGARVVGIFENLHWDRYDTTYAERFIQDTLTLAVHHPHIFFLVKPHHAGQWLTSRYRGAIPRAANLVIADPAHPEWEHFTASQLINSLDAVITTPSTVALDAARAGKPVAVVAYGLDLSVYRPLPVLTRSEDWMAFLHDITDDMRRGALIDQACGFVARTVYSGSAAASIVRRIEEHLGVQCSGWRRPRGVADSMAVEPLQKVV